jgi:hypothetical protein
MKVPRTSLSRWEHGHEMPCGENMLKLNTHLFMPIGAEIGADKNINEAVHSLEVGCQLALPFDQPADFEIRMIRKGPDVVQLELRFKGLAS